MRSAFVYAFTGLVTGISIASIPATEAFSIGSEKIDSIGDVEAVIGDIETEFELAQCGGWIDDTVNGKIAEVQSVPGRNSKWDGAILSGMGTRRDDNGNGDINDDFKFPTDTGGFTTTCFGSDSGQRRVWRETGPFPGQISLRDIMFPGPKFQDPSCKSRLKEGNTEQPPVPLPDNGTLQFEDLKGNLSPGMCRNFCMYLNRFVYLDCIDIVFIPPTPLTPTYPACNRWGFRFFCSGEETPTYGLFDLRQPEQVQQWKTKFEEDNQAKLCPMAAAIPQVPAPATTEIQSNARSCKGEECRCPTDGFEHCKFAENSRFYYSFFRRYLGKYNRSAVQKSGPADKTSGVGAIACYGQYDEFDPATKQIHIRDRRCVINIDAENMRSNQEGKGLYGKTSNLPQRKPGAPGVERKQFDQTKDLWYLELGSAFSLLNEKVFKDDYVNDLTRVYLDSNKLDDASMHATEQIKPGTPWAKSANIRAFDETGEKRIIATWWQKQQNEMAVLLHPPVVRLLLPSNWSFGVSADDPLLKDRVKVVQSPEDKRNARMEVQIDATDEDILGVALSAIERSMMLRIEEEPVPVLVPAGSPTEFRAKAEAWCAWYMQTKDKRTCTGSDVPAALQDILRTLELYADNADEARILRSSLPRYAAKVLDLQQQLTAPVVDWVRQNINAYRALLEQQKQLNTIVANEWRQAQEIMNDIETRANQPWCMNQRFTAPIYSLLDPWLPSRADGGKISADGVPGTEIKGLPNITVPRPQDIFIDFSTITAMTGSLKIPVLKPVQVTVNDIPSPPNLPEKSNLPVLPSIEDIRLKLEQAANNLPKPPKNPPSPPPIQMDPPNPELAKGVRTQITQIKNILGQMRYNYDLFWKAISPLQPLGEIENEGERQRQQEIKDLKEKLECTSWADKTCQFAEMELREILQRFGSRPDIALREDYDSKSTTKTFGGTCIPSDDVCTPMHPEQSLPRQQWEIIGPKNLQDQTSSLRTFVREAGLPQPVGNLPKDAVPPYSKKPVEILPSFDVPLPIDLSPPSSSSSSSARP